MQRVINGLSEEPDEDRANALAAAERATELSAGDPTVLRTLGNVLSNCGEHEKAVRALRRAVEIAPFDFRVETPITTEEAINERKDELWIEYHERRAAQRGNLDKIYT